MVDNTGSRWPVNASTVTWNQSSRLGVYYKTPGTCSFNCVHVEAYAYTDQYGPSRGKTRLDWDANGHFKPGSIGIVLNTYWAANSNKDRSVTCHEIGHALGLDHQGDAATSCMTNGPTNFPLYPNDHDWNLLFNLYNH